MNPIRPASIRQRMIIVDEANESAYVVVNVSRSDAYYYVEGRALTPFGQLLTKNFSYLEEDGELYCLTTAIDGIPTPEEYDAWERDQTRERFITHCMTLTEGVLRSQRFASERAQATVEVEIIDAELVRRGLIVNA